MAKKRIFVLVSSMEGGGAERVAALLCNQWVKVGHDVTLMPTFSGWGGCAYPLDGRVRLEFLASYVGGAGKSVGGGFRRLWVLRRVIRNIKPDIVVSFLTHVNVAAILASLGLGIPVVVSERIYPELSPVGRFWSAMRRLTYPCASCVVVQTELVGKWIDRYCPGSCVKVIPNPVLWPLPTMEPTVQPGSWVLPDRKLLLAVGRLHPQKGFGVLLDSFADLACDFPDWDLVILGEGPERERLEARRTELGLDKRIQFPGQIGNVGSWYECADLYVMSSFYEGFPNTLMEAMSYGLPVVSFDCETGPAELIRHGENGWLVPISGGTKSLGAGLQALMADGWQRKALGESARAIRQRFSVSKVAEFWDQALDLNSLRSGR